MYTFWQKQVSLAKFFVTAIFYLGVSVFTKNNKSRAVNEV